MKYNKYLKLIIITLICCFSMIEAKQVDLKIIKNVKYLNHEKSTLDFYIPKEKLNYKVIFMVHGGAWMIGDKTSKSVIKNKMNFFTKKGYIFVSTNYRLVPDIDVYEQATDISKSILFAKKYLKKFGIKSKDFILMGHSAGAHLVSLISTNSDLKSIINPWLGTISIDSAALNVPNIMNNQHRRFYNTVFGKNKTFWEKVSPYHQLGTKTVPFLVICSNNRKESCIEALKFTKKLESINSKAKFLNINLNHRQLNNKLGVNNKYTKEVNSFIDSL